MWVDSSFTPAYTINQPSTSRAPARFAFLRIEIDTTVLVVDPKAPRSRATVVAAPPTPTPTPTPTPMATTTATALCGTAEETDQAGWR